MNIKTIALAAILVTGLPLAAQAQETNSYDSLNVSCQSGAECSDFGVNFQEEGDTVAQTRRTRTRRTSRSSSDSKIYAGGTLGLFFPGDNDLDFIDPGTGFGGSINAGYKFTDLISADADLLLAFGGNDVEDPDGADVDGSYTLFSLFVGPRLTYKFSPSSDTSPYVFASPGIGVGSISFGGDVGDELGDNDSGGGFALQGKVGAGYPISDKLDIIGQARYANIFGISEIPQADGDTEDDGLGYFGVEAGVNFKF